MNAIQNSNIKHLKFGFYDQPLAMGCVGKMMKENKSIEILHLSELTKNTDEQFFEFFEGNKTLTNLELISLDSSYFQEFSDMIKKNQGIKDLRIVQFHTTEILKYVFEGIKENQHLQKLEIRELMPIANDPFYSFLVPSLENLKILKTLSIMLNESSLIPFGKGLAGNKSIKDLKINFSQISEFKEDFFLYFNLNTSIESFKVLSLNSKYVQHLKGNENLKSFTFLDKVKLKDLKIIVDSFVENKSLTKLILKGLNEFLTTVGIVYEELENYKEMARLCSLNKSLTFINLGLYNFYQNETGKEILKEALLSNRSLLFVKCDNNSFGDYRVQCHLTANKHTLRVSKHFPLMEKVKFHQFNFKMK
jgi:hypothetical protein